MRSVILLAVSATACFAEEKPSLLGEWRVTSVEGEGLGKTLKENVASVSIDAEKLTAGREALYTADFAKGTIDLIITGGPKAEQGKYPGLLELKGNELKLHFALPGAERPTDFTARAGSFVIALKKK